MRLTRPRAVLFDWDNTLVDSYGVIHIAINETLAAMGHETWTFEDTCRQIARSIADEFEMLGRNAVDDAKCRLEIIDDDDGAEILPAPPCNLDARQRHVSAGAARPAA